MSSSTSTHPDVMYDIAPRPKGGWLLTEKKIPGQPRLSATARGEHSKIIPFELHQPQHVPPQTLDAIGYHSLDDNEPVFARAMAGRKVHELLEAQTFSPQHMKGFGLWEKLVELQGIILKPGMADHMASLETTQNRKRVGTVYNLTWSVEPNGKDGSIRPGVIAKKKDPHVMRMVQLISEISFELVKKADGAWKEEHERQWVKEASLTCGGGENKSVTSIQVNLTAIKNLDETIDEDGGERSEDGESKSEEDVDADATMTGVDPDETNSDSNFEISEGYNITTPTSSATSTKTAEQIMEETLKDKSHVHKDSHDERRNFSCILFLNHVPQDHFVGRFNITNFRLTCTCIPFSGLVFPANNPHGGSGFAPYGPDLPLDSPLRFTPITPAGVGFPRLSDEAPYTRCLTIAYSRQDCMRARTKQLNPSIYGDAGLGAFITRKAQANWMIRHAIRDGLDIGVANPSVDDYLKKFSWIENGVKCYEDRKLVEDAFALKGTDNKEWELMLKATAYNSAHIKHDHPSRYESPKQRKARQAREVLGDDAYCTQITSKGTRCKAWLARNADGVKMCGHHYKIFMASKGGTQECNSGEAEEVVATARALKRLRDEGSEEYEEEHDEDDDVIHVSRPRRRRGSHYESSSSQRGRY
ncbi:hypothetical protein DL98DRAFT_609658 [Cadophora sp. DSE1049]|nr:hypothetical protein DL98DRAFT_609658 [Cadophora sp. DSE1049]